MTGQFNESTVEEAALSWFDELGYGIAHGPSIAPGEPGVMRGHSAKRFLTLRAAPCLGWLSGKIRLRYNGLYVTRVEQAKTVAERRAFFDPAHDVL